MSITDGLRKGDIVTHSRTMEVAFAEDGYVELHDTVAPRVRIGLYDSHQGSDKIEVVKKAKPSAGTVITGAELKAIMWKRGTVIVSADGKGWPYMLNADGGWDCPQIGSPSAFGLFRDGETLKLVHVA